VVGRDALTDSPLISLQGHLGTVKSGSFSDLVTETLYFDVAKFPWDMQQTAFNYLAAVDELARSSLKSEFIETFDENGDGIVSYEEFGKKGVLGPILYLGGATLTEMATRHLGYLRGSFKAATTILKLIDPLWNPHGLDLYKEYSYGSACAVALRMSELENESPDPFLPGLTWGKGKWPSFELAKFVALGMAIYGEQFPSRIVYPSLYAVVFRYADLTQNEGRYTGQIYSQPDPEGIDRYVSGASSDREKPLDFIFHVPPGYGNVAGLHPPNVQETDDPAMLLTASLNGGQEAW